MYNLASSAVPVPSNIVSLRRRTKAYTHTQVNTVMRTQAK